jgi:hypothetical protein
LILFEFLPVAAPGPDLSVKAGPARYTGTVSPITAISYAVPLAVASGLNLYATVAVVGLCARFDLFDLPAQFALFEHPAVIVTALVLFAVEFVADKVPWFDSLWDAIHTVIRPVGGAVVAVSALGDASPLAETLIALLGGSVAMTTHLGKAGTRAAVNTSPEPFSNWTLSLIEDVVAIGLTYAALEHPYIALALALILLGAIVAFASVLFRFVRRRSRPVPRSVSA